MRDRARERAWLFRGGGVERLVAGCAEDFFREWQDDRWRAA